MDPFVSNNINSPFKIDKEKLTVLIDITENNVSIKLCKKIREQ